MNQFESKNVNPKKRKTSDCVIRALALGLNKSWREVFDLLIEKAREMCMTQNATEVYTKVLDEMGFKTVDIFYTKNGKKKRYRVNDFPYREGYIVVVANHLTFIKGGKYYDTFDCGNKAIYKAWRVQE